MDRQAFEHVSSSWTSYTVQEVAGSNSTQLQAQSVLYSRFADHIVDSLPDGPYSAVGKAVGRRSKVIATHFAEAMNGANTFALALPALHDFTSTNDLEKQFLANSSVVSRIIPLGISYLAETALIGALDEAGFDAANLFITSEIASYWAWKAGIALGENQQEELRSLMVQARAAVGQVEVKAGELENTIEAARLKGEKATLDLMTDFDRKTSSLEKRHLDLGTRIIEQGQHLQNNQSFTQTVENNFKAFAEAVREELKINTAKRLWDARSRSSQRAFIGSAIAAALLILIPIGLAFWFRDGIISYLHVIEAPATQVGTANRSPADVPASASNLSATSLTIVTIGRLLTVTIPIALWFWLIKLVVRYNYRSMVLADDARQRSTMMDTYFHLIEHQAASVEDRALILAALFRPAPGHGSDNVDPPDFTDFINKMKGS